MDVRVAGRRRARAVATVRGRGDGPAPLLTSAFTGCAQNEPTSGSGALRRLCRNRGAEMSTDDTSGNRWEPSPSSSESDPASEHPTAAQPPVDTAAPQPAGVERHEGLPGHRGWFAAGAAAVVFIVGGAGGFMVGHAAAG